jgi:hypothetical protein
MQVTAMHSSLAEEPKQNDSGSGTAARVAEWRELASFEAPYLEEKMLNDRAFHDREMFRLAFGELKKYLWLYAVTGRALPMTSQSVDEVWHQFILFTVDYHRFCDRFFGGYIHHSPNSPHPSVAVDHADVQAFFLAYQRQFGPVPRIWADPGTQAPSVISDLDDLAWDSLGSALKPGPHS